MEENNKIYLWKLLDHPGKEQLEQLLQDFERVDPEAPGAYEQIQQLDAALRQQNKVQPAPGFVQKVMAALPAGLYPKPKWSELPFIRPIELIKVAAMIAVVITTGWLTPSQSPTAETTGHYALLDGWADQFILFVHTHQHTVLMTVVGLAAIVLMDKWLIRRYRP